MAGCCPPGTPLLLPPRLISHLKADQTRTTWSQFGFSFFSNNFWLGICQPKPGGLISTSSQHADDDPQTEPIKPLRIIIVFILTRAHKHTLNKRPYGEKPMPTLYPIPHVRNDIQRNWWQRCSLVLMVFVLNLSHMCIFMHFESEYGYFTDTGCMTSHNVNKT